jgi:hypothetical protein
MAGNIKAQIESISDIKSKLLRPSLTSHYFVEIQPKNTRFIDSRINASNPTKRFDRLSLACSEASLPGSSLATIDIDNDFPGVSEKHAYRRLYDDRADFTFYVDAEEYYVIRFFESWIGYCVDEQYDDIEKSNYSYRVNYPDLYKTDELSITKFERDYNNYSPAASKNKINTTSNVSLKYKFIGAYPISISSMPVSYDTSQLLKCTVSFFYQRYRIDGRGNNASLQTSSATNSTANPTSPGNPELSGTGNAGASNVPNVVRTSTPSSGGLFTNLGLPSDTRPF